MKDVNPFTLPLFCVGVFCILDAGFFVHHEHWGAIGLVCAIIVVLDLFPIELPNGSVYSGGIVGFMYLLLQYGFPACELGLIVSTLASFVKHNRWRFTRLNWYRLMSTLGMFNLCIAVSFFVSEYTTSAPTILRSLLALMSFEVTNLVMLYGILQSVKDEAWGKVRDLARTQYLPDLIFAVILARFLSVHGNQLWVEATFSLFFLAVIYIFSVQYRKMANKYKESEEKYRLIAENTLDVIVVLDDKARVIYASPSHVSVFGWGCQEYLGSFLVDSVHEADRETLEQHLEAMRKEMTPFQVQFQYKHRDKDWVLVEGTGSPVVNEEGKLDRVVMVVRDITERAETEELLRKSDKLAVVGQLAAGVAHELRNPLTALKGFLQLLEQKAESGSQYIDIMRSELNRIELIIGEFLILAKPHVVQFQRRNPQVLLQSVIALLDTQAILNNVQIVTMVDDDIPDILCEENQLKQVFINILKNAIEAMPSGGQISIEVKRDASQGVVMRFRDQGVGIPEENLSRIGEPFYTTKESGTGLGLMISYRIIQAHRGRMMIQSHVNQGTTVEINLPEVS